MRTDATLDWNKIADIAERDKYIDVFSTDREFSAIVKALRIAAVVQRARAEGWYEDDPRWKDVDEWLRP